MSSLMGLVAMVSGGSSGIGRGIALRMAEAGATVVLADRNREAASKVVEMIEEAGGNAHTLYVDVASPATIQEAVSTTVSRFGRIDLLFNNAGISRNSPFLEITLEQWDELFEINARGAFFLLQTVARQMCNQEMLPGRAVRGKIVNTGSLAAFRPTSATAAYGASKAVIVNLTRSAALALAPYHINVNAVCPGYVDTPLIRNVVAPAVERASNWSPGEYQQRRSATIPLGRFARPEDIANLCLFLAGPESDYMTGQAINVDGGVNMG